MRLEEELKQSKFRSEHHRLAVNILFTGSWFKLKATKAFKKYGVSLEQFNVLRILRGQHPNPATINLIMDRMMDKTSNASRIVERLRLKKLLERRVCEVDRRQVDVIITQAGLDLLAKLDKEDITHQPFIDKLSISEAATLNTLLDKLRD